MSELYLPLKLIHILSATVLFGTGLGTAFFMWRADRSRDVAAIAQTARTVVIADTIFTLPAVIVQPVTGVLLALAAGYDLLAGWIVAALVLYVIVGACWLPVVWLQLRMRDLAVEAAAQGAPLPPRYHRYMRRWFALGWPAFLAVLAIFVLMLFRPAL
jgi:uncharacterized membrane protein